MFLFYLQYQQWIDDERIYLLRRIEKLEHENHQLLELYQTYQIQNEKSIQSITNLILKILLTQQVKYP
jgi:adenylate kinase family enzyme